MGWRRKWKNPSGTKTYYAWRSMRSRCINPKSKAWENYGGRGIKVCDRWEKNYDAFFDDMGEASEGMTLDRIDYNGDYTPENCRWVGWGVQAVNKRVNRRISHGGETLTQSQWARRLGIEPDTLYRRLSVYSMPVEKALSAASLVPESKCGTRHQYEKGCRCTDCRAAHAARFREIRRRRREAIACGGELAMGGKP